MCDSYTYKCCHTYENLIKNSNNMPWTVGLVKSVKTIWLIKNLLSRLKYFARIVHHYDLTIIRTWISYGVEGTGRAVAEFSVLFWLWDCEHEQQKYVCVKCALELVVSYVRSALHSLLCVLSALCYVPQGTSMIMILIYYASSEWRS